MPLPGQEINIQDVAGSAGTDVSTGTCFFVGQTPRGPEAPIELTSYGDLIRYAGDRPANGVLHDSVETAFATGLARGYLVRVVGTGALAATVALPATSGASLTVTATSRGVWGNALKVQVADAGSSRVRLVVTLSGEVVEQSPAATTRDQLLTWSTDRAQYIRLTAGATNALPTVAAALSLATGTDGTVDQAAYDAALARITPEHGTGQLTAPGVTDEDVHLALLTKAADPACQRFAVLDADPTDTASALAAKAAVLTGDGSGAWGTIVHPRVRVPAPAGGIRWVPASAFWAGRVSYTDATEGVGQPPAGADYGEHRYAVDVETVYSDTDRETLNEAGVIVIARINGAPRIYGARTLADYTDQPAYRWVNGTRAVIRYRALAQRILERFVLRRIKGDRSILVELSSGLNAMGEGERIAGNLYGDTAEEAYRVDTRYPSVNSQQSLADGWLKANAEIRVPPVAERVQLNLVVRSPGDNVTQG